MREVIARASAHELLLSPVLLIYALESGDPKTGAALPSKFFKTLTIEVDERQHAVVAAPAELRSVV